MPVGRIHHQHIHIGLDQPLDPFHGGLAHPHGGPDPQPLGRIQAGVGVFRRLLHILDRDQAGKLKFVVDDQDLFNAVPVQQFAHLVLARVFAHRDQPVLAGHDIAHGIIQPLLKA